MGVVVAAETLREAFSRLEVLENCAAVAIRCRSLLAHSAPTELTESQVRCLVGRVAEVRSLCTPCEAECELRMVLAQVVQRALRQKLFGGWSGTVSARISAGNGSGMLAMLISPANTDRQDFTPDAFVAVECQEESGSEKVLHEPGKIPSVGVKIHEGDLQDASRCELCDCIGCSSQCKWHSEQHHPQQDHNSTQR